MKKESRVRYAAEEIRKGFAQVILLSGRVRNFALPMPARPQMQVMCRINQLKME